MVCSAPKTAVFRPRRPRDSLLYQLIARHYEDFQRVYSARYQQRYGYWRPAIGHAVRRFLRCGDPAAGFARIRCPDCCHEMFVPFSCRRRCLCASCHQKRSLIFADQVAHGICAPVPHRQYVLTVPKRLRIFFRFNRRLLGRLMRLAWETINQSYREALGRDDVVPGVIAGIQTFGALAHFHPHVHAIATDGAFTRNGSRRFICAPPLDMARVRQRWEDRIFHMLLESGKISLELVEQIRGWKHSGFSVDGSVRLVAGDTAGLYRLAQYMVRCPFSLARIVTVTASGQVIYRAEKPQCRQFPKPASRDLFGGVPRNFQVFDPLDFLAELSQHIPDKGEHLVRYYGWYSHRASGVRAAQAGSDDVTVDRQLLRAARSGAAHRQQVRSWAMLIQRVWEVDPLRCTKCGAQMRVVSFIEARQEQVIRQILEQCGLWQGPPPRLPPARPPPVQKRLPPPREVQLVLDPEFACDRLNTAPGNGDTPVSSESSPASRHLVPDPDYLEHCRREADTHARAASID